MNQASYLSSSEQLFPCSYPGCGQLFRSRFSCKRHQQVHTKVRPYICEECEKKFASLQHLKEHKYRHNNVRPYVCNVKGCQKSFRHSSELSHHRRTHPEYRLKKYQYAMKDKNCYKDEQVSTIKEIKVVKEKTSDGNSDSICYKERSEEPRNPEIKDQDSNSNIDTSTPSSRPALRLISWPVALSVRW